MRFLFSSAMLASAALLLTGGCSISAADGLASVSNTCDGDGDCGLGGVCAQNMCVSTKADLSGLFIQIDTSSGAPVAPGTSSLVELGELELQGQRPGGYFIAQDLFLSDVVNVYTALNVSMAGLPEECAELLGEDGTFPIGVRLTSVVDAVAIPLPTYAGSSDDETATPTSNGIEQRVPAGRYDVYVVPELPSDNDEQITKFANCKVPPLVLSQRDLKQGEVSIAVSVGEPLSLLGSISGFDLEGWRMDLVDNARGRLMSTTATLPAPDMEGLYNFELRFWDELIGSNNADAIVRLTPPEDDREAGMPTVLWKLTAVDLDGDHVVALDVSALAKAEPVQISGSVYSGSAGVPSIVAIQSSALLGGALGGNAWFKRAVPTDSDGRFSAMVLPGEFTLAAIPSEEDLGLAITTSSIEISQDTLGSGQDIELDPHTNLSGQVFTPTGENPAGMAALLQPASAEAVTYLQSYLSVDDAQPSSQSSLTDGSGHFGMAVDPGVFDLSVRPEPSSNLPWLVRPRISLQPAAEPTTADLAEISITNPVVLQGTVRAATGQPLPNSLVRVWLAPPKLSADDSTQTSAFQIAETTSDALGSYRLLLPASVSQ